MIANANGGKGEVGGITSLQNLDISKEKKTLLGITFIDMFVILHFEHLSTMRKNHKRICHLVVSSFLFWSFYCHQSASENEN